MARRFPAAPELLTDAARALAAMVSSEKAVLTFVAEEGLEILLAAAQAHGEGSAVENEVVNVFEQAICSMCEQVGEEAPEEELDAEGMAELLRTMTDAAHARVRAAAEAKRKAEDEARERDESEARARRQADEAERERVEAIEKSSTQYAGFSWGSSFDDPRIVDLDDAPDAPRIVELDDD